MSVVLSAQFATKVHFLKAKRVSGIKSSRVSRATVAAGAGKKPDDDEKPRGFPRLCSSPSPSPRQHLAIE
jgi:hypothetical protein